MASGSLCPALGQVRPAPPWCCPHGPARQPLTVSGADATVPRTLRECAAAGPLPRAGAARTRRARAPQEPASGSRPGWPPAERPRRKPATRGEPTRRGTSRCDAAADRASTGWIRTMRAPGAAVAAGDRPGGPTACDGECDGGRCFGQREIYEFHFACLSPGRKCDATRRRTDYKLLTNDAPHHGPASSVGRIA